MKNRKRDPEKELPNKPEKHIPLKPDVDPAATNLFMTESKSIPFHAKLEFIPTYSFLLWETILQAQDAGALSGHFRINEIKMLTRGMTECAKAGTLSKEMDKIRSICLKNEINLKSIEELYKRLNGSKSVFLARIMYQMKYWLFNKMIDCDRYNSTNVYEAALLQEKLKRSFSIQYFYILLNVRTFISKIVRKK